MTTLDASLTSFEVRFREIAESPGQVVLGDHKADPALVDLGLVAASGELTDQGNAFYIARHVRQDSQESSVALAEILERNPIATAFCGTLWGSGEIPVAGAVSLLKRLTRQQDSDSAKRWLELMNRGKLVAYNRKSPSMRILFNPEELVAEPEAVKRERAAGHVISPDSPYGNLLALRELLRAAEGFVYWYEQHFDQKVLEVLYRELAKGSISVIRILSGPANVNSALKGEFKRFRKEMSERRNIQCEWRVLSRKEAQQRHDRFFFSESISRNLPPLNLILAGSKGEILPSQMSSAEFNPWWEDAEDLMGFEPATKNN